MKKKSVGVVLAGGQSRRFGSPKAFAKKNGKEFYLHSIDALKPLVESIAIITNSKLEKFFNDKGVNVITDKHEYKGQGPLAGIYTAMDTFSAEWYMTIPVDVPFMDDRIMKILTDHLDKDVDAVIPVVSDKIQPLIAIYRFSVKDLIKNKLTQGKRAVISILNDCKVRYVPIKEEQPFYNINNRLDYDKWIGIRD